MKRLLPMLFLLVAVSAAALVAVQSVNAAQHRKDRGAFQGVVLGPDDKPVPHAAVIYQSSAGSAPHAVHTDSRGHFTIPNLHWDNYDLRASSKGVFSEWEKNVTLHKGETREITLRLIYARSMPKTTSAKSKSH
ncbi:MAG TPA: carboxypeptidase-like regulatory domain-containing protein [Terriglobales bacterium]|nr:carboxypeptidase-like regulatory domain-containing protein [Terriglobales bacterium]